MYLQLKKLNKMANCKDIMEKTTLSTETLSTSLIDHLGLVAD